MSPRVTTIKIPDELFEKMQKYRGKINFSAVAREAFVKAMSDCDSEEPALSQVRNLIDELPNHSRELLIKRLKSKRGQSWKT